MKTALLLLALLIYFMPSAMAQKIDSATVARQKQYDYYWNKRNSRNKTGWILIGTGLTCFGIVALQNASASGDFDYLPSSIYGFAVAGVATTLISIPFFLSATENKRKARLSLKGEQVSMGINVNQNLYYTAATVTIKL